MGEEKTLYVACYVCKTVVEGLEEKESNEAIKNHQKVRPTHLNVVLCESGTNYEGFKRVDLNEFVGA